MEVKLPSLRCCSTTSDTVSRSNRMGVTLINSRMEFQRITDSRKVVAIDLWEERCEFCKMIAPLFEEYSNDPRFSDIEFYSVNCSTREGDEIAQETRVTVYPSFFLFHSGNKIDEMEGANRAKLLAMITKGAALAA